VKRKALDQVVLQNSEGEAYTLHAKAVSVEMLVNPAMATLTGTTTATLTPIPRSFYTEPP
jgi:hypothetical protein